ncbi:KaiA-binding protein [Halobiforma lacisalsi AJ5]|uniref:Circadian clock protein KaiC n=1 Tax=Natronobacterium lacisalsi AJ5 TaxID=358396 RepID=M0L2E7_NATLA|nr:ATPase domain-containing protein [Halobiforma lacisalsi]APW98933.1 KaiA-binding protein [Halobiforma lacisalsi AJ5]EMA27273.1 circadian clock protein KaiC [Halobiforma lacisalsi AJ5]
MRIPTGVPGFDELVDGGLLEDRLYIVSGPPGSGKTTFCSQFLTKGVFEGETALYLSMHESKEELVTDMSNFEFGFEQAISSSQMKFLDVFDAEAKRLFSSSSRTGADSPGSVENLSNKLVSFVESKGVDRLVIDSTMLLEYYFSDDVDELVTFLTKLKRSDATVLLISEMTDPTSYSDGHYLAHGVVFMHNYLESGGMTRGVQIIKMRGTQIDCDIREAEFTDRGLRVKPNEKIQS